MAWRKKDQKQTINIEKKYYEESIQKPFKYGDIVKYPIKVRENVLNSIYKGEKLYSVRIQENSAIITYTKK